MCYLTNIMLLPLAIPFTLLTLSVLPNIVSYQIFAFVDAHLLEHPIIFMGVRDDDGVGGKGRYFDTNHHQNCLSSRKTVSWV